MLEEMMLSKKAALMREIHAQYQIIYDHLLTSERSLYGDIAKHYKVIYAEMKELGTTNERKEEGKFEDWQIAHQDMRTIAHQDMTTTL